MAAKITPVGIESVWVRIVFFVVMESKCWNRYNSSFFYMNAIVTKIFITSSLNPAYYISEEKYVTNKISVKF